MRFSRLRAPRSLLEHECEDCTVYQHKFCKINIDTKNYVLNQYIFDNFMAANNFS